MKSFDVLFAAAFACMRMCIAKTCPLRLGGSTSPRPAECPFPDGACGNARHPVWMKAIRRAARKESIPRSPSPVPCFGRTQDLDRPASLLWSAKEPASLAPEMSGLEKDIMRCVVRYPERIGDMASMGAQRMLSSPFARSLWTKIAKAKPGEAGHDLDDEERAFWDRWRGHNATPRTDPNPELNALKKSLEENLSEIRM